MSAILVVNGIGDAVLAFRGPLIRDLVARGHRVIVSTPQPECVAATEVRTGVEALGAELVFSPLARTSLDPRREWHARRHWQELIANTKPDAILATNPKPVFHVLPLADQAGVAKRVAMITGLGYAFTSTTLRARVVRFAATRLYRKALRSATALFFQNEDDRREFARRALVPASLAQVQVVGGSGVDLAAFPQRPVPAGSPSFLMIARLLGDKGVREFAQAARLVRARHPDARFRLVGWIDGNPAAIRRAELDAWCREGIVEWTGRLDDVRPELERANVFVLPSYREGMPHSTLEALATGRAIVTTDAPGCRDTVVDGVNGFLVPPRDAPRLADACMRLVAAPELRATMGQASRALAVERFDVNRVNGALIAALES